MESFLSLVSLMRWVATCSEKQRFQSLAKTGFKYQTVPQADLLFFVILGKLRNHIKLQFPDF